MQMLTEHDVYLFREGTLYRAYEKLGALLDERDGVNGARGSRSGRPTRSACP